ncbi:MAG: putative ABC transporter permease [Clostridia bacterium]|nr:putative ABC transporter permease [Clostridia bacterium]
MQKFLTLAFLFFIGSVAGWVIELIFRRFVSSSNPEHKWINPGFCTGPYLPIYGVGLCVLYLLAQLGNYIGMDNGFFRKGTLFFVMAIMMTAIEYIAGIICLKSHSVRLWDYSDEWGNIQGIICPKFSIVWAVMGAVYYFAIHPYILGALDWLSKNYMFSFFIGLFFGVFILDVAHSTQLIVKLKEYSEEHDVIVRYEMIKASIRKRHDQTKEKYRFFRPFKSDKPLHELLREYADTFEMRKKYKK